MECGGLSAAFRNDQAESPTIANHPATTIACQIDSREKLITAVGR
jgi:hypothetical protein